MPDASPSACSLTLPPGEIHIWHANLATHSEPVGRLLHLLSPDEHSRAAAYHRQAPRDEYCCARVLLRMLLSRYGFGNAAELAFTYSSTGKPALQGHNIHFSVSHSEGLAVYALSATGPVGVDVEKIRPVGEMQGIVDRYFPAQARAAFQSAPESERTEAFFRLWTRREAVLKAIGIGIPGLDEQIDESLCMVLELNVDQGYHAALAHEKSPPMKIVQREVPLGWSAGFVFLPDAHG